MTCNTVRKIKVIFYNFANSKIFFKKVSSNKLFSHGIQSKFIQSRHRSFLGQK